MQQQRALLKARYELHAIYSNEYISEIGNAPRTAAPDIQNMPGIRFRPRQFRTSTVPTHAGVG
jgi:hypothetical protein